MAKPKPKKPKHMLGVRIDKDDFRDLGEIARNTDTPITFIIRRLIKNFLMTQTVK